MVKPLIGESGQCRDTVLDLDIGDAITELLGQVFTHDCGGSNCDHVPDETMRIDSDTLDSDEHRAGTCQAGVVDDIGNFNISGTHYLKRVDGYK